jgi:hypothetical protein
LPQLPSVDVLVGDRRRIRSNEAALAVDRILDIEGAKNRVENVRATGDGEIGDRLNGAVDVGIVGRMIVVVIASQAC